MILNEPEKLWIITCFMAMSNVSFDAIIANYNKAAGRIAAATEELMASRDDSPAN